MMLIISLWSRSGSEDGVFLRREAIFQTTLTVPFAFLTFSDDFFERLWVSSDGEDTVERETHRDISQRSDYIVRTSIWRSSFQEVQYSSHQAKQWPVYFRRRMLGWRRWVDCIQLLQDFLEVTKTLFRKSFDLTFAISLAETRPILRLSLIRFLCFLANGSRSNFRSLWQTWARF